MDVECGKCGKMVSSNDVKVDAVNQWYVCLECINSEKVEQKKKYEHEKMDERKNTTSKVRVACNNCSYKYLYDTWKKYPRECPYCAHKSASVVQMKGEDVIEIQYDSDGIISRIITTRYEDESVLAFSKIRGAENYYRERLSPKGVPFGRPIFRKDVDVDCLILFQIGTYDRIQAARERGDKIVEGTIDLNVPGERNKTNLEGEVPCSC